jgi:hypothetical protein
VRPAGDDVFRGVRALAKHVANLAGFIDVDDALVDDVNGNSGDADVEGPDATETTGDAGSGVMLNSDGDGAINGDDIDVSSVSGSSSNAAGNAIDGNDIDVSSVSGLSSNAAGNAIEGNDIGVASGNAIASPSSVDGDAALANVLSAAPALTATSSVTRLLVVLLSTVLAAMSSV